MSELERYPLDENERRRRMAEEARLREEVAAQPMRTGMAGPIQPAEERTLQGTETGVPAQNAGAMMSATQGLPYGARMNAGPLPPRMKRMTTERIKKANDTMAKYKGGKARLEARLIADEEWWRGHAWSEMLEQGNSRSPKRPTKWLTNVILGKHADMMDAYPEPVILPREQGDELEARTLTSILPVVLEQNHFKTVYRAQAWEKCKHGTAAYAVYWDRSKLNGLGDVNVCGVDLLNLYWEPGITDIQQSRNVFLVEAVDKELLIQQYPQLRDKNLQSDFSLSQYRAEDRPSGLDKALVVDWYYHTQEGGQKILHYCKYVGLEVLYASEDDATAAGGWYEDGEYPFVLDVLFPQKESPAGWGYIDLGKDAQEDIDLLDYAITMNAQAGAIPRYFRRDDSAVNLDDYLDFTKPIVEVAGGMGENDMVPIAHAPLDGIYVQHMNNKIEELKQTCGNQDVSNGITSGVTAASGIAAQQEAAGRTSRDGNAGTYEAFGRLMEMVIERIRQFYDVPRTFRILGEQNAYEFVQFDNSGLIMQENAPLAGQDMGWRKPLFDIKVSAQKENAYTKMAQNELAIELLNAGVFNPQMTDQSLLLLSMMDFPKKDELARKVQQMGTMMEALAYWQSMAMQFAPPEIQEQMAQSVLGQQGAQQTQQTGSRQKTGSAETNPANSSFMNRAREASRQTTQPQ